MTYVKQGSGYDRDTTYITTRITADARDDGYRVEPGRYRLIASRACPWANRAIIVRRLLGLEPVLSMGLCGPTHDERSWTFDLDPSGGPPGSEGVAAGGGRDPVLGIERLQEAYFARFPGYWLTPHGRERLGGRPFGDGTPPGPPVPAEVVPSGHGAA